ncbi:MAG: hypothetical protein IMHGJWDQ_000073 [Candidatus Fervidibacter sp.]
MKDKTHRRTFLRRLSATALASTMSIPFAPSALAAKKLEPLQVVVPDRVMAGQPFTIHIVVSHLSCPEEETRWVELWLGCEYLGRFEVARSSSPVSFALTLCLAHSTTLRVRDFHGRTVIKHLRVSD